MGYLRQRTKGSWQICIYGSEGSSYHETVRGSKADARVRMIELEGTRNKGVPLPRGRITLGQHLDNWFDGHARAKCSQRTQDGYLTIIERHLKPALGHIQLKELQPQAIQAYYGKACERLSGRTVQKHHRVLSQALKYAVRQGILGRNVCDLVDAPSGRGKTMRTLTPGELEALLAEASTNGFYHVIYTAASTGMRQAELLGLRWRDIDLDMCSISVNRVLYKRKGRIEFKEPKTAHSRRRIAMTPKLALSLKEYKAEREVLYLENGRILGLDDLVFANTGGEPIDPSVLSHTFAKILKRAGLEPARFHDLRHTFASIMLLRGAKPKVISEALGHASVAFTLDVYSHILGGMQEEAMALLDEIIPAGTRQNSMSNHQVHDGRPA